MSFVIEQASFPLQPGTEDQAEQGRRLVTRAPPPGFNAIADREFLEMLDGYRAYGGLARLQEVLTLFRQRPGVADLSTLAYWMVSRKVVCFEWQQQSWFPLFQLDREQLRPKASLQQVLAELSQVYDPWDLAYWFARPSPWLDDRSPVQVFDSDLQAVLYAARADRFVASG